MDVEAAMRAVTARLGRFHLITCSLLSLVYVYQAMFNLSYIFTTMRSEYRWVVEGSGWVEALVDADSGGVLARIKVPRPGVRDGRHPCRDAAVVAGARRARGGPLPQVRGRQGRRRRVRPWRLLQRDRALRQLGVPQQGPLHHDRGAVRGARCAACH